MKSSGITWGVFFSETVGTALLLGLGLSIVIVDFGTGSPVLRWLPDAGARRFLTGFLFGTTGALIAVSPVGKHSGAHINPVVTLAFWLAGKMRIGLAAGYVLAQLVGAVIGAAPLIAWGRMGQSVEFAATVPGPGYSLATALAGEIAATFLLIVGLFWFVGHPRLRKFTPLLFPVLYAVMVWVEGPISGTSTNPARSLGPALIAGAWRGWWVYWVGPIFGTLLGVMVCQGTLLRVLRIEVAKVYHFKHDPHGVFRTGSMFKEKSR